MLSVPFADRVPSGEPDRSAVGLHGLSGKHVIGVRLRVFYCEECASIPYEGVVEALDAKRGLRVHLDGYPKREWVTDEDEWEWIESSFPREVPRPVELVIGCRAFREVLARLSDTGEMCAKAARGRTPFTGKVAGNNKAIEGGGVPKAKRQRKGR